VTASRSIDGTGDACSTDIVIDLLIIKRHLHDLRPCLGNI